MARERKNAPPAAGSGRRRGGASVTEGIRRRIRAEPDVVLSDEELRALADDGLDVEEIRRAARDIPEQPEASIHDRDSPRDQLEGLILQEDDDEE